MPDWRGDVAGALQAWLTATATAGNGSKGWRAVGPAAAAGDGWFATQLALGVAAPGPDELGRLRLESAGGEAFAVLEAVHEGGRILVRAGAHAAAAPGLVLQTDTGGPEAAIKELREQVRRIPAAKQGGLAAELAAGRLAGAAPPAPEPPAGFGAAQAAAYAACLAPGLRLVWAPPGTGATTVLARAATDLAAAGRRVLLLAPVNQAVDDAVEAVLAAGAVAQGELVRVGPPSHRAAGGAARAALGRLVTAAGPPADVEGRRAAVERRLGELLAQRDRLAELDATLAGYDHAEYLRAAGRLTTERSIERLRSRVADLSTAIQAAGTHTGETGERLAAAEAAWAAVAAAREHLAAADRIERELAELQAGVDALEAERRAMLSANRSVELELSALPATSRGERWQRLVSRRHLRRRWETGLRAYAEVAERAAAARERLTMRRDVLGREAAEHRAAAEGVDLGAAEREQRALQAAKAAATLATAGTEAAAGQLELARADLARAEAAERPSAGERRLAEQAEAGGLPALHTEQERLARRVRAAAPTVEQLTSAHERLAAELAAARAEAGPAAVAAARVVAATLTGARTHPALAGAGFDAVLVDQAAAASLPELLVAVARAGRTAVLVGDFRQPGPALPAPLASARAGVTRWLAAGCFAHCGIASAAAAAGAAGCTVMDEPVATAPDLVTLANAVAYEGVLLGGRPSRSGEAGDGAAVPEVLVADVDGLGDLAAVRRRAGRGRWWPAGVVVAGALAAWHAERGESVGVVTATARQAEATAAALADGPGLGGLGGPAFGDLVQVGPVERFAGRRVDVAVVDLVADGRGGAAEALSPALLALALTRARLRLYVLAGGRLLDAAPPASALAALAGGAAGAVGRVGVTDLLTPAGAPRRHALGSLGAPGAAGADLAAALATHTDVADVADEHALSRAMRAGIDGASDALWLWAGWEPGVLGKLLPLLRAARTRGVRVTVFAPGRRDGRTTRPAGRAFLAGLYEVPNHGTVGLAGAANRVVRWDGLDRQLVVVDGRLAWLGGLNTLAERRTRPVAVRHDGAALAAFLLDDERAAELAGPPVCPTCARPQMELGGDGPALAWRCADPDCPGRTRLDGDGAGPGQRRGRPARGTRV